MKWRMYANQRADGWIHNIFLNRKSVEICYMPDPIIAIDVTEDPNGKWWGWVRTDSYENNGIPSMIHEDIRLVDMCFPYGMKEAEKAGDGHRIQLHVEVVPVG